MAHSALSVTTSTTKRSPRTEVTQQRAMMLKILAESPLNPPQNEDYKKKPQHTLSGLSIFQSVSLKII